MSRGHLARVAAVPVVAAFVGFGLPALAGGIDHKVEFDDSGIWSRSNQLFLRNSTIVLTVGAALWEGSDSRLGHTYWESIDAVAIGAVTAQAMKVTFSRARPSQTDDPNLWFQGHGHNSFPSGEVMTVTTAITPIHPRVRGRTPGRLGPGGPADLRRHRPRQVQGSLALGRDRQHGHRQRDRRLLAQPAAADLGRRAAARRDHRLEDDLLRARFAAVCSAPTRIVWRRQFRAVSYRSQYRRKRRGETI